MQITVNDKNNFYFGQKAEVIDTQTINGKGILRVMIKHTNSEITFAIKESDAILRKSTNQQQN